MKIKTIFRVFTFAMTMLVSLSACTAQHIPLGEYRIEWDEYDPDLHGQVVFYNEPMIYAVLGSKEGNGGWKKMFVEVGRILQSARMDSMTTYGSEPIVDGMLFKVKGSFWLRQDWLTREMHGDTHYLVMIDENGVESIASFARLINTNQPDLANFKNKGRFR